MLIDNFRKRLCRDMILYSATIQLKSMPPLRFQQLWDLVGIAISLNTNMLAWVQSIDRKLRTRKVAHLVCTPNESHPTFSVPFDAVYILLASALSFPVFVFVDTSLQSESFGFSFKGSDFAANIMF
jgi:hypothetical protein